MIRAVFFDLYNTLAGFYPPREEIQARACAESGIQVAAEGIRKGYAVADAFMSRQNATSPVRGMDSQQRREFFSEYERLILEGAGVAVSREQAWQIWQRIRQMPYRLTRFDDVLPALDMLKSQGLVLGLISNINQDGRELAESLGLTPYLDFTVTSAEVGSEKPHPPIFLAALARAGTEPHETVHVGDQLTSDVEGARGVGIQPVLLDRDGNHVGYQGCPRIEGLMELPALLATFQ